MNTISLSSPPLFLLKNKGIRVGVGLLYSVLLREPEKIRAEILIFLV
jgi:hypothetical protein